METVKRSQHLRKLIVLGLALGLSEHEFHPRSALEFLQGVVGAALVRERGKATPVGPDRLAKTGRRLDWEDEEAWERGDPLPLEEREGEWVYEGDMIVGAPGGARGVVHYGEPWPCAQVRYWFTASGEFAVDKKTRSIVRSAIGVYAKNTDLDIVEIKGDEVPEGDFVQVRQWQKGWGSAHVGWQGGKQNLNIPASPSKRLVMHEFGHSLGLGHEHQHPLRVRFIDIDLDCVEDKHRSSFKYRPLADLEGDYDFDSIMHYRSSSFCADDTADADGDGSRGECSFVDDNPDMGKCYPIRRIWGRCSLDVCKDKDGDGFREYIGGAKVPSAGDFDAINRLHEGMTKKTWPAEATLAGGLAAAMEMADTNGDRVPELWVARPEAGDCGELWEYRPDSKGLHLRFCAAHEANWRCEAEGAGLREMSLQLQAAKRASTGGDSLFVAVSDNAGDGANKPGWIEQWARRGAEAEDLQFVRKWEPSGGGGGGDGQNDALRVSGALSWAAPEKDGAPGALLAGAMGKTRPGGAYLIWVDELEDRDFGDDDPAEFELSPGEKLGEGDLNPARPSHGAGVALWREGAALHWAVSDACGPDDTFPCRPRVRTGFWGQSEVQEIELEAIKVRESAPVRRPKLHLQSLSDASSQLWWASADHEMQARTHGPLGAIAGLESRSGQWRRAKVDAQVQTLMEQGEAGLGSALRPFFAEAHLWILGGAKGQAWVWDRREHPVKLWPLPAPADADLQAMPSGEDWPYLGWVWDEDFYYLVTTQTDAEGQQSPRIIRGDRFQGFRP